MLNSRTFLKYDEIFQEEFVDELGSLFNGIDTTFALGIMQHLNFHENRYKTTEGCIYFLRENWFSHANAEVFLAVTERIDHYKNVHPTSEIVIFNAPSNLSFFESLLRHLQTEPVILDVPLTNAQKEIALLKAYLLINSGKARPTGFEQIRELHPGEEIFWQMFAQPFQYADLVNRDLLELWQIETFKAIKLFEYLEKDVQTAVVLNAFLANFNCNSWRTYLKASAGMAIATLDTPNLKGNNFIEVDPELPFYNIAIQILGEIGIVPIDAAIEMDYLYLRNRPIYRTGEGKFQVIYKRFFIEKIFRSLYFQLSGINQELGAMTAATFRNKIYTSGFSENTLLYTVLNKIFEGQNVRLEGSVVEAAAPQFGASDYLASAFGNVFIFESKDILIKKEVKDKLFMPELRDELRSKFYKDGNSDKAVLQLAKNVKKVLEGKYESFGFAAGKYRLIYPVIVVHSDAFNTLALNQLLFQWFKEACFEAKLSKSQLFKVRPAVLVDISTLTYFHQQLGKRGTNLNTVIDLYLEHVKMKYDQSGMLQLRSLEQMMPFSAFLNQYIRSTTRVRTSKWLIDIIQPVMLP
ncbi:hypothetical protein ACJVDH_02575 [Pedobacter sp. AW1-32]|uniref:hypothetical protein n=1 Tax=Pedobacter sp. AW1-32 TaxID=3383026 RepID=UPI003FF0B6A8